MAGVCKTMALLQLNTAKCVCQSMCVLALILASYKDFLFRTIISANWPLINVITFKQITKAFYHWTFSILFNSSLNWFLRENYLVKISIWHCKVLQCHIDIVSNKWPLWNHKNRLSILRRCSTSMNFVFVFLLLNVSFFKVIWSSV